MGRGIGQILIHTLLLIEIASVANARDDLAYEAVGLAALALEVHGLIALGLAEAVHQAVEL